MKIIKSNTKHRVAYVFVATLLLFILALLPFAVSSIFQDIVEQSNITYQVDNSATENGSSDNIHIHLDVVSINEWDGTATFRVSAHNNCKENCSGRRIVFSSVFDSLNKAEDVPTTQSILIPNPREVVTQNITLPLFGDPIRYPFDEYRMGLGTVIEDIKSETESSHVRTDDSFDLAIQARVPRIVMAKPITLDSSIEESKIIEEKYANVQLLTFNRPLYIRILTILLVLLISTAAACAVFMRPLNELVINSGALVLGVWGIRSILLGVSIPGITSVDLALSTVILFILVAIVIRTFHFLDKKRK